MKADHEEHAEYVRYRRWLIAQMILWLTLTAACGVAWWLAVR